MSATPASSDHYRMVQTDLIRVTAERGDKLRPQPNVGFISGRAADGVVIEIMPERTRQVLLGIGTSMTEASAFVLAQLDPALRQQVMQRVFGEDGANFSMARVPIGSCDFCVEGRYSYAPVSGDIDLKSFSIEPDLDGFDPRQYPDIKDPEFDLLPMIREAKGIKRRQRDGQLRIMASAWTAPPWMKDIDDWFVTADAGNDYQGSGGQLNPEHQPVYAAYLDRYLSAYRRHGIDVWAITPVNEPLGNGGHWESMHFTPSGQNEFIKNHLGPCLRQGENRDVEILIYDHSRDQLEDWCDAIYADDESSGFVAGAAVHWYESSFRVYEEVFERVHARYPDKLIVHSEGCIDSLGVEAPGGVTDPEGYMESGWFDNDAFWWSDNATDYAYSATWPGVNADEHPAYTPVHRYARNIIVSLNHWVSGWIDWNIVLNERGGPNHVGNYCGAPIMIDSARAQVYYTPVYNVLAQLSQGLRPGDRVVESLLEGPDGVKDTLYCCAAINRERVLWVHVLNTARRDLVYHLQVGDQYAPIAMPGNSLQSVRLRLPAMPGSVL